MKPIFYHQPAAGSSAASVDVQAFGIAERMRPGVIRHGGAGFPYLFMHFQTPAFLNPDTSEQEDMTGATIIWAPGEKHYYGNFKRHWTHSWLNIGGSAVADAVKAHAIPLNVQLRLHRGETLFIKYLRALNDELQNQGLPDVLILEGIIDIWCREMSRAHRGAQKNIIPQRLLEVRQYMQNNFMKPVTLGELAASAHLSISQFSFLFRKHFNQAPIQYLQRLRMKNATILLEDHSLAVYEIAEMVGFNDPLFFSKQFRKYSGRSPRDYRYRNRPAPGMSRR